jgi:hypothetical protein
VRGTTDYKVNWLGWENCDVEINVDLEKSVSVKEIKMSTLQNPKSWILHPVKIICFASNDGINYSVVQTIKSGEDLRKEEQIKMFSFTAPSESFRFIRFKVEGTKVLPDWHTYVGSKSWVFIDEITIK